MVIDSVSSNHSTLMLEANMNINDEPVKYIFYSHNHWDHGMAGRVLKEVGIDTSLRNSY